MEVEKNFSQNSLIHLKDLLLFPLLYIKVRIYTHAAGDQVSYSELQNIGGLVCTFTRKANCAKRKKNETGFLSEKIGSCNQQIWQTCTVNISVVFLLNSIQSTSLHSFNIEIFQKQDSKDSNPKALKLLQETRWNSKKLLRTLWNSKRF